MVPSSPASLGPADAARRPASPLMPVGRHGALVLLVMVAIGTAAVWYQEARAGVLRPLDVWAYPSVVLAAVIAWVGVWTRRVAVAPALQLLTAVTVAFLGLCVPLDVLGGHRKTAYELAVGHGWLLVGHVILAVTFAPRHALLGSLLLAASVLPLGLQTMGPSGSDGEVLALVLNVLVTQLVVVAALQALCRPLSRLAGIGPLPGPAGDAQTLAEWVEGRMHERQRLHSQAQQDAMARREQERERLALLKYFPGIVSRVDADGRVTLINPRMAALLGTTPERTIGRHTSEVVGEEAWRTIVQRQAAVCEGGRPITFERRIADPQGGFTDLLATQFAVPDEDGRPTAAFYQVGLDVSELRRAQRALVLSTAQLDALFEAIPLPTIVKDADGRYQRVNRAYCELLGKHPEDLLGRLVRDFLPVQHWAVQAQLDEAARVTRQVQRFATARVLDSGRRIEMIMNKAAAFTPDGEFIGIVSTLFDITEINAAARLREEARASAESANAAKSAFLATMSHEIRTPMNGIIGMAEVLLHTPLDERQAHSIRTLCDSAQRLLHLLDDVLDFSKIEAGRLSLDEAVLDVRALVSGTAEIMAAAAHKRGVALRWRLDDAVPPRLLGDDLRLRQVLTNLLSNAIKFSSAPDAGRAGRVSLCLAVDGDAPPTELVLRVTDNGIGMDDATQARIFEPFVQAEASTTRRFGGSGLGLAITRRLVALMGGRIELHSWLGAGTTFIVRLPLRDAPAEALPAVAPVSVAVPSPPLRLRILVAEDEPVNCEVLVAQLQLLGHDAEVVHDGGQALERWRIGVHDLVLTDLHMPVMDGHALARAIRAEENDATRIPVIALTAHALKGEAALAREAGIDEYLTKPVAMDVLQASLQRWGRGRASLTAAPAATVASVALADML